MQAIQKGTDCFTVHDNVGQPYTIVELSSWMEVDGKRFNLLREYRLVETDSIATPLNAELTEFLIEEFGIMVYYK